MSYQYQLKDETSGGDRVYNCPLKDWTSLRNLPEGLTLDDATGKITGVPTRPGKVASSARCWDSYGPPQASKWADLTIEIKA